MNPRLRNFTDGIGASFIASILFYILGEIMSPIKPYFLAWIANIPYGIWIFRVCAIIILAIFIFWVIKSVRRIKKKEETKKEELTGFPLAFNNKLKEIQRTLSMEKQEIIPKNEKLNKEKREVE